MAYVGSQFSQSEQLKTGYLVGSRREATQTFYFDFGRYYYRDNVRSNNVKSLSPSFIELTWHHI